MNLLAPQVVVKLPASKAPVLRHHMGASPAAPALGSPLPSLLTLCHASTALLQLGAPSQQQKRAQPGGSLQSNRKGKAT